jgi:hypothetical protein
MAIKRMKSKAESDMSDYKSSTSKKVKATVKNEDPLSPAKRWTEDEYKLLTDMKENGTSWE